MKKKIIALCLCIAMLTIAIAGGTLAYFTDEAELTNEFTAGNVAIDLYESLVKKATKDDVTDGVRLDDYIAAGGTTDEGQTYELHPAQTVLKDPTIKNTGENDAWIAAKIIVTGDIHSYTDKEGNEQLLLGLSNDDDNIDIHKAVSGGLLDAEVTPNDDWNGFSVHETADCVIYQDADKAAGEFVFYVFMNETFANGESVVLFEQLNINKDWGNEEMAQFDGFAINVKAFGVQSEGFEDCFTAMKEAFPAEFGLFLPQE